MRLTRFLLATLFSVVLVGLSVAPAHALILDPIYSVSFVDASTGYLAGYRNTAGHQGFISVTHDGGQTWAAQVKSDDLMHAVAVSGSQSWAVPDYGNVAYRSIDGGLTWSLSLTSPGAISTSVQFNDVAIGPGGRVIVGGVRESMPDDHGNVAYIRSSGDGGASWSTALEGPLYWSTDSNPNPPTYAAVQSVDSALSGSSVWALANEWNDSAHSEWKRTIVYKSMNGGSTFATATAALSMPNYGASDITAVSDQIAFVGAPNGVLRKTVDGGATWVSIPVRVGVSYLNIYSIEAYDANTIVAVGSTGTDAVAACALSIDGGATWTRTASVTGTDALRSVSMLDASHWVAVGDNETVLRFSADPVNGAITYAGTTSLTAPAVKIDSPAANQVLTSDVTTITGTASDSGSGVTAVEVKICRDNTEYWNGTTWQSTEVWVPASTSDGWGHWSYRWVLARGQMRLNGYTLISRATDGMGLTTTDTVTGVKVDNHALADTTPPVVTASVAGGGSTAATLTIGAADDSGVAPAIAYSVNNLGPTAYSGPVAFSTPGSYDVTATATDGSGNVGTATVSFTVVADNVAPTLTTTVETSGTPMVTVRASAVDGLDQAPVITYAYTRNGLPPTTGTYSGPLVFTTGGSYVATITATDRSGNAVSKRLAFDVVPDTTAPTLTVTTVPDGNGGVELTIDAGDAVDPSPAITYTYIRTPKGGRASDYGPMGYAGPHTFNDVGDYSVAITASDASGNSTSTPCSFTVTDTAPPNWTGVASVVGNGTGNVALSAPVATDDSEVPPMVTYTVNGGSDSTPLPRVFTVPGSYIVEFTATDGSGNRTAVPLTVPFTVVAPPPPPAPHVPATPERIPGDNRYDVAVKLARTLKPSMAFTDVIVACGEDRAMADPLGAAALAAAYDAPVLLTPTAKTNAGTVAAIKEMAAASGGHINIHVVGGATSIPKAVYNALSGAKGAGTIERINGANRYALAYQIAARTKAVLESKGKSVPGVIVVNIENANSFNDALAASPASARAHLPLIGVKGASVPSEAAAALSLFSGKPRYALNSAYLTQTVRNATGAATVVAGSANREVAAVAIAQWGVASGFVSYNNVGLANKLSDALPAGAVLGQLDGVMLYTGISPLSPTTSAFLPTIKNSVNRAWVFGGTATITDATAAQFRAALQ